MLDLKKTNNNIIMLTGVTSFTGCHIAKLLLNTTNYKIFCLLTNKEQDYTGIKKQRLEFVKHNNIIFLEKLELNSPDLINKIQELKPSVFINHGAYTKNYRNLDFEVLEHLKNNIFNIKLILESLKNNNCKLFIHSGSSFEPDTSYARYGISPYGVAKKMVWDLIAFHCNRLELNSLKIYIPNPYGYLENEDRLLPVLNKTIRNKQVFTLRDSSLVRNNIKVENLAQYYLQAVKLAENNNFKTEELISEISPVGYLETQIDFLKRASQEEPYCLNTQELENFLKII